MSPLSTPPARGAFSQLGGGSASIAGGWGYKPTDAFILAAPHGSRPKNYNNTIPVESRLVRARNEAEFSTAPAPGHRHAVVDYGTITRTLKTKGNRMFAVWRGEVRLISEAASPELYQRVQKQASADRGTRAVMAQAKLVRREYWFDITDAAISNGGSPNGAGRTMAWPDKGVWIRP